MKMSHSEINKPKQPCFSVALFKPNCLLLKSWLSYFAAHKNKEYFSYIKLNYTLVRPIKPLKNPSAETKKNESSPSLT